MSRRAIRKAFPEADLKQNNSDSNEDDSEASITVPKNPFSALNESSESEQSPRSPSPVAYRPLSPIKKVNQQRQKKKKQIPADALGDLKLEQALTMQRIQTSVPTSYDTSLDKLLHCESRYFDSERELRNVFGASALRQDAPDANSQRIRRPQRGQRTYFRKTAIIKPKDEWNVIPLGQIGLFMQYDPDLMHFQYVFYPEYAKMQEDFESCSMTFDPQSIATLLQFQPWHCDTLLQMAEIYRIHGEFALSSDLVARALYVLECNFHSKFDVLSGGPFCNLNVKCPSSNSFFRGIRRHMQFIGRRGSVRTAFEYSKVFFNVTRSSHGSLPCTYTSESLSHMAYYALKCQEFLFLLEFASHYDFLNNNSVSNIDGLSLSNSILMLPIWAFSVAMAKFRIEKSHEIFSGVVLVNIAIDKSDISSSELLQQALLLYPETLEPLLMEISSNEGSKVRWKSILSHRLFKHGRLRFQDEPVLQKLVKVFVTRCYALWKEDEILDWLVANCEKLISKLDEGICVSDEYDLNRAEFLQSNLVECCSSLEPSEFSDSISTIPVAEARQNEAIAVEDGAQNPFVGRNPFVAFLASLLPWFNLPDDTAA